MKVIWICHFSNEMVRKSLPLSKRGREIADFAPWISLLINEFQEFTEVDLHVVSPHGGLRTPMYSFDYEGTYYHFFKPDVPFFDRPWPHFFQLDAWTGYLQNRLIVRHFIYNIKPDIINLIGAENPYYSGAVLGIKDIPVLVSIQGIYSDEEYFKVLKKNAIRYNIERKIHGENKYFGIDASYMPDLIKRDSRDPILFWNRFPIKTVKLENVQDTDKVYDFVFFSRLTMLKGTEDALHALALVKKQKADVTLRMMGPIAESYLDTLRAMAMKLGIENNVEISGGFALQEDMLKEAVKARNFVLPTRIDAIPSAIVEAIHLGLPVVSYRTGDIPLFNKGETRVLLCDKGDIASLAKNMLRLLEDPTLGTAMSRKAKQFVQEWFDNTEIAMNYVHQYRAVLAHYYKKEPVPPSLLYDNYIKEIGLETT